MVTTDRVNRLALLSVLERGARGLRLIGLGALVDRLHEPVVRRADRFRLEVRGFSISGLLSVHGTYVRELLEHDRERHVIERFEAAVRPGSLVLDVGAYVGLFTLVAARCGATVIALEPDAQTVGFLRENVRQNGLEDRVTVVEKAAAAHGGRRTFFVTAGGDTSSLHRQPGARSEVEVETVAVDDLVAGRSLDVVKLDVEGAELEALEGMQASLAAASEVVFFVEWNPDALARAGANAEALPERLRELGLEPQVIDEVTGALMPLADGVLPAGAPYVNLFCERGAG